MVGRPCPSAVSLFCEDSSSAFAHPKSKQIHLVAVHSCCFWCCRRKVARARGCDVATRQQTTWNMAMAGRRPIPGPLYPLSLFQIFFFPSFSLSFILSLRRGDTDNMQMEHRATAIIYGSYHAARDLMTVYAVCVGFALSWAHARSSRNRPADKRRIPALCPILSGHLDKFIRRRGDDDRMQLSVFARTVAVRLTVFR